MTPPRTLLVTGGCGYLGSALLRLLPDAFPDAEIRVLDNLQRGTQRALMGLPTEGRYTFLEGDLLDPGATRRALDGVDAVVHLAALVRTPMSFENPTWMEQVNHWGTARLLEACRAEGVRSFVYTSTTAVYGPGGPFDEDATCRPVGPYASSKRQAEVAIAAATERGPGPGQGPARDRAAAAAPGPDAAATANSGLQTTVLRLGMLYGLAPAMRFDGVVNRLAFLAGTGRPLTVYGDGLQRRPVVHVEDAARAVLLALDGALSGGTLNVAAANPTVLELVETLRRLRPGAKVHYGDQDVLTHLSFEVSSERARRAGWAPRVDHEAAMREFLATLPR